MAPTGERSRYFQPHALNALTRYALSLAITALAVAVGVLVTDLTGNRFPFLTIYPAVAGAALLAGTGPGLLTLVVSVLCLSYFWLPSLKQFRTASPADHLIALLFLASGALLLGVIHAFHRSRQRLAKAHADAELLADRLRVALQVAPVHLCTTDRDLRYTAIANPLTGFTTEQILGKRDDELFPPESVAELIAFKAEVLANGVAARRDITLPLPDGRELHYDVTAEPLLDNEGRTVGVIVAALDVTERVRASHRAIDSERRLRLQVDEFEALLRVIPVGIGIASDRECKTIRVNPAFAQNLGLPLDANASLTAPDDQRPGHFRVFREGVEVPPERLPLQLAAREGVTISGLLFDIVHDDGRRVRLMEYAAPLRDESGEPRGSVGAFVDLSERLASEERFRLLADVAPVLIWMTDASGSLTWANRARIDFAGRTLTDLAGDRWLEDIHPDDRTRLLTEFASAFERRSEYTSEYRMRRRDGEYRWVLDHARALFEGAAGSFSGYVGSGVDITDLKLAEAERARLLDAERAAREQAEAAHAEAERVSRSKDEFLATLSHELRTPLNAVLGWLEILRPSGLQPPDAVAASLPMPAPSAEDLRDGLEAIERNARAQAQLIEDLLDMSRIISGKLRLELAPVDLASVVDAAVATLQPAATAKSLTLSRSLPPGLKVLGDPHRLQQIVWNLLSNAIKFTPGGGSVSVTLSVAPSSAARAPDANSSGHESGHEAGTAAATDTDALGRDAVLTIADTGQGISPGFLPLVFDRFRQADGSTTRRHGGLGLGLALVRQLVELHGGTVAAHSDGPGRGSTFSLAFPLLSISAAPPVPAAPPAVLPTVPQTTPMPAADGPLADLRLLLVEDDPDGRALVRRFLSEAGAHVDAVPEVDEALRLLAFQTYDVLVSDIGLPVRDGYDLCRSLRADPSSPNRYVPAIALTAFARPDDQQRAVAAGFSAHLSKPVDRRLLVDTLADLARTAVGSRSG